MADSGTGQETCHQPGESPSARGGISHQEPTCSEHGRRAQEPLKSTARTAQAHTNGTSWTLTLGTARRGGEARGRTAVPQERPTLCRGQLMEAAAAASPPTLAECPGVPPRKELRSRDLSPKNTRPSLMKNADSNSGHPPNDSRVTLRTGRPSRPLSKERETLLSLEEPKET